MKSAKSRVNDLRKLVEGTGLKLLDCSISGGTHYRLVLERSDGEQTIFFASLSPSDRRAALNNRALMRRFANGTTTFKEQR